MLKDASEYDVIIVGAGIGGLVCGCYLAKNKFNVLIVEKSSTVGGCCTSFSSKGFYFDAFAHSLGGVRPGGVLDVVLKELEILERIYIERHDPSDTIITPSRRIHFWHNLDRIIDELKSGFPAEASNIERLMRHLTDCRGGSAVALRNTTFSNFLSEFTKNRELQAVLTLPVLGNAGLPASLMSAFTAIKLYQEFHFDGGYYPIGGMQVFADALSERFQEYGGALLKSRGVSQILLNSYGGACGAQLKTGEKLHSSVVVSACDAHKTFSELLKCGKIYDAILENMETSISVFSIYVGLGVSLDEAGVDLTGTVWHMFNHDTEEMYLKACKGEFDEIDWFMIFPSPDRKGFVISILAPFKDVGFWEKHKDMIQGKLLAAARARIPVLREAQIQHTVIITPQIISKWTSNLKGAAYGWASTPSQCAVPGLTQTTLIDGLYLTGHWTTQTIGVSGVAYMARSTAALIKGRLRRS